MQAHERWSHARYSALRVMRSQQWHARRTPEHCILHQVRGSSIKERCNQLAQQLRPPESSKYRAVGHIIVV